MSYKLYYFKARGRGEQIRVLLHALEQPFEDIRLSPPEFMELKQQGVAKLPFGSMPMLEDGDFRLAQGPVIMSYLAKKHGMAPADPQVAAWADAVAWAAEDLRKRYNTLFGKNPTSEPAEFAQKVWRDRWLPTFEALLAQNGDNGHFAGKTLTHADIAVWDIVDACIHYVDGCTLDGAPKVAAFYDAVAKLPAVAGYVAARPE